MAGNNNELLRDPSAQPIPGKVLAWCRVPGCEWGAACDDEETARDAYADHIIEVTSFGRAVSA